MFDNMQLELPLITLFSTLIYFVMLWCAQTNCFYNIIIDNNARNA